MFRGWSPSTLGQVGVEMAGQAIKDVGDNKKPANKKSGQVRISEIQIKQICNYFNTVLSVAKIAKIVNCDERTVSKIFNRNFNEKDVKDRMKKIQKIYLSRPSKRVISDLIRSQISKDFFEEVSLRDVGKKHSVAPATVAKIWKETFGNSQYDRRKRIVAIPLQKKRSEVAKTKGSKNEILCFNLLQSKLNYKIIHHDYEICPPYEIDITIPEIKFAVNWDGLSHRKEIYASVSLKTTKQRDSFKNKVLLSKGWTHIVVIDDGKFNESFVSEQVEKIVELIKNKFKGRIQLERRNDVNKETD